MVTKANSKAQMRVVSDSGLIETLQSHPIVHKAKGYCSALTNNKALLVAGVAVAAFALYGLLCAAGAIVSVFSGVVLAGLALTAAYFIFKSCCQKNVAVLA